MTAQEPFFGIAANDRAEALQVAAARSGRPAHVLEKDTWVVWTLSALFDFQQARLPEVARFEVKSRRRWKSRAGLLVSVHRSD